MRRIVTDTNVGAIAEAEEYVEVKAALSQKEQLEQALIDVMNQREDQEATRVAKVQRLRQTRSTQPDGSTDSSTKRLVLPPGVPSAAQLSNLFFQLTGKRPTPEQVAATQGQLDALDLSEILELHRETSEASGRAAGLSATTGLASRELQKVRADGVASGVDALVEEGTGALGIDSSDKASWIGKGDVLVELGRLEEALRCYDAALQISPESWAALEGKGLTLHRLQRFSQAVLCFDMATEVARNNHSRSWAWNYKGSSLLRMGRALDALEWCDKAIDAWPTESAFLVTKGNCLRNLRRFEEALKCYEQALTIWPRDWVAWFNKGTVQEDLGRIQDAIAAYRSFLDVAPPDATDIERAQKRLRKLESSE